jgi:hypothetical protein
MGIAFAQLAPADQRRREQYDENYGYSWAENPHETTPPSTVATLVYTEGNDRRFEDFHPTICDVDHKRFLNRARPESVAGRPRSGRRRLPRYTLLRGYAPAAGRYPEHRTRIQVIAPSTAV